MRLTALLIPESSSWSLTLDITEAVDDATSTAKEMPSSTIGASVPRAHGVPLPNASSP